MPIEVKVLASCACALSLAASALLLRRIRVWHVDLWHELGSPRIFHRSSGGTQKMFLFLWGLRWLRIKDPVIKTLCALLLASSILFLVVFLLSLAA